ncbi:hypothetical protein H0484_03930 [Pusillimonas sp. CC-YST705]|uniref:Uncharacterized protein n=1 Tax=Mesopusillimonas faecipullorum TaxID=2755040 RepID=A0ABS8CBA5_9BURK|nr:hypothetical protein [Mesopusillimonas faecipullorum]MCB5362904.1 hypothetical protein [Mesopusillimonas faecipullorum]
MKNSKTAEDFLLAMTLAHDMVLRALMKRAIAKDPSIRDDLIQDMDLRANNLDDKELVNMVRKRLEQLIA